MTPRIDWSALTLAACLATAAILPTVVGTYDALILRDELDDIHETQLQQDAEISELRQRLGVLADEVEDQAAVTDLQETAIMMLEQDLTGIIEERQERETWPAGAFALGLGRKGE